MLAPSATSFTVISQSVMIPMSRPAPSNTGIEPLWVLLIRAGCGSMLSSARNVADASGHQVTRCDSGFMSLTPESTRPNRLMVV